MFVRFVSWVCFLSVVCSGVLLDSALADTENDFSKPVSCEELSDGFCRSFWSSENQGNLLFPDGTHILYGDRRKNIISNAKFIYNQKLAKNRCKLPKDVKDIMGIHCEAGDKKEDILSELASLLSQIDSVKNNKTSIELWRESIDRISVDFDRAIREASYKRSRGENPEISEKPWENYTPEEKKNFNGHYYDIKTKIMDAIYLDDPDWLRVVKVFGEAKADVLAVIDKMAITPETKQIMKEKISLVSISLPYEDPRKVDSNEICATELTNAYYSPFQNSFYFCMGSINTSHREGSFYGIIAHEIAHSVDPRVFSLDIFTQTSLPRLLREVYESNASIPCEDWERQKADVFLLPSDTYQLPEGLAAMDQCLVDRQHLGEWSHSSLDYASQRVAEFLISSYAGRQDFSYLVTPKIFENAVLTANELYMNPKLFAESKKKYFASEYFSQGYFHIPSVFIQEYECRRSQPNMEEDQAFAEALEETKRLNAIYQYYYFRILGRNSRRLIQFNLSKPSGEEFADWVSNRAIELRLQRMESLKSRRNFIFSSISYYCPEEGLESIAKHKTLIEKSYSRKAHSPDRDRRLKHFTSKTAELLQCVREEEIKKLDKNCD